MTTLCDMAAKKEIVKSVRLSPELDRLIQESAERCSRNQTDQIRYLEAQGREVTISRFIEQAVQQYIRTLRQSEALAVPSRLPPQKVRGRQR